MLPTRSESRRSQDDAACASESPEASSWAAKKVTTRKDGRTLKQSELQGLLSNLGICWRYIAYNQRCNMAILAILRRKVCKVWHHCHDWVRKPWQLITRNHGDIDPSGWFVTGVSLKMINILQLKTALENYDRNYIHIDKPPDFGRWPWRIMIVTPVQLTVHGRVLNFHLRLSSTYI